MNVRYWLLLKDQIIDKGFQFVCSGWLYVKMNLSNRFSLRAKEHRMFDVEALNEFYNDISDPSGMSVTGFQNRLETLFSEDRSDEDLDNYRLGRLPWKKLRDEIIPVSRFLKFKNIEEGEVRFPLDNNTPDCWLLTQAGDDLGIEVTIESGREHFYRTIEMIETGMGRGFIGVQDDASTAKFDDRMSNSRIMYSSEQALEATKAGVLICLSKKNNSRYQGIFYLLIQANLSTLPTERWVAITDELSQQANDLPFQEVHIIGNKDEEPWGFQIK